VRTFQNVTGGTLSPRHMAYDVRSLGAAKRNPETLLSCCSRPAVRVRPLPTFVHRILSYAVSISAWTPGSPLTGITVQRLGIPTCLWLVSCSPQPAACYWPSLSLCCLTPRARSSELASAPDLPPTGKTCKTVKERFCFYLPRFCKSTLFSRFYLVCFQSSAARPQAGAEILCNANLAFLAGCNLALILMALLSVGLLRTRASSGLPVWTCRQKPRPERVSREGKS